MSIFKQWKIRVIFNDESFIEDMSKKNFREDGIIEIVNSTEKKFPNKKIFSVKSS